MNCYAIHARAMYTYYIYVWSTCPKSGNIMFLFVFLFISLIINSLMLRIYVFYANMTIN